MNYHCDNSFIDYGRNKGKYCYPYLKELLMKYKFGEQFIVEKTSDEFIEVEFDYKDYKWVGALPLKFKYHGYEISLNELKEKLEKYYNNLDNINQTKWITDAKTLWTDQTTQTYKVFNALLTSRWECRVCGPVPKVNPQAASRIRDIKKKGFIVATKRRFCSTCNKNTIHDILLMIDIDKELSNLELRKPISKKLAKKIYAVLNGTECFFEQKRTQKELIIDHKFPSQRWTKEESDNLDSMTDNEIKEKFQLLSNQTNLLKSKECDRCVFEGERGSLIGIQWYYQGNINWSGEKFDNPKGCIGCPWYDVVEWKKQLKLKL